MVEGGAPLEVGATIQQMVINPYYINLRDGKRKPTYKKMGGKELPEHITSSLHFSKGLITKALDDQLQNQTIERCRLILSYYLLNLASKTLICF